MQKGFAPILILVGILVIGGLVGGAYYLGTLKKIPQVQNPTINSQVTPSSNLVDETASWKEYIPNPDSENPMLPKGVTFKYPSDWQQGEGETGGIYFGLPDSECGQLIVSGPTTMTSGVPFEDTYSVGGFGTLTSRDKITIDGYEGIKQIYYRKGTVNSLVREVIVKDPKNPPYKDQFGSIATPILMYVSQYIRTDNKLDRRCEDTFSKVLDTFKFLK